MIDKYLESLINDRNTLADNLVSKGIPGITGDETFTELVPEVLNIPSGSVVVREKDVNFYDYDGTITNSYTAQEFLALTTLPDNPTHEGLTSQGWNWTLTDAQDYVTKYGMLEIGQMYVTDDGATRIYVTLNDENNLSPIVGITVSGSATIDWGDNSQPNTITGTRQIVNTPHTYQATGDYVISIKANENSTIGFNGNSNYGSFLFYANDTNKNLVYQKCVNKIECGDNINFGLSTGYYDNIFKNLISLETITMPNSIINANLSTYDFEKCYSLKHLTFPSNFESLGSYGVFIDTKNLLSISIPKNVNRVTGMAGTRIKRLTLPEGLVSFSNTASLLPPTIVKAAVPRTETSTSNSFAGGCIILKEVIGYKVNADINDNAFNGCYQLKNITLGDNLTTIGERFAQNCYNLEKMIFPSTLTTISGGNNFAYCYSAQYFDFSACLQIPTLANTNAFYNINANCKIIVPDDLYEDWVVATNWSTYADYIVKEGEWNA